MVLKHYSYEINNTTNTVSKLLASNNFSRSHKLKLYIQYSLLKNLETWESNQPDLTLLKKSGDWKFYVQMMETI